MTAELVVQVDLEIRRLDTTIYKIEDFTGEMQECSERGRDFGRYQGQYCPEVWQAKDRNLRDLFIGSFGGK